ncbi:MAG: RNA-binding transcriptional accessory protein [Spirochaetales bacterium]|nr:RNA-binding transcriptional accessory protein [Spirochaetales bacterium]
MNINLQISKELNILEKQVFNVINLLKDGGTVPFISRYRKELTGELDEVAILSIKNLMEKYEELEKRKISILKSLEENNFLTKELNDKIEKTLLIAELEDLYLPYKPKRKTRGVKAREEGLEPLSENILKGKDLLLDSFLTENIKTHQEALNGAKDIIAEMINEDHQVRSVLREKFNKKSVLSSTVIKGKTEEAEKFKDYFSYSESINKIPSHRLLAILRGVSEGFLKFSINIDEDDANYYAKQKYAKGVHSKIIEEAIEDGYKRLLQPSLETEIKNYYKFQADSIAIDVFKENLKNLLLSPPLGEKIVLAIDPGLRTGSKVVVLDRYGTLLENTLIKPLQPHNLIDESTKVIKRICEKHKVEFITIGNGTGGREMETFIQSLNLNIPIVMTNEAGASIYSASQCARDEFPNLDLTVRGAISIGRRLMDPLAELVKIDPKSIGVGQYQHDVDQKLLKESLVETVESCVNSVGVEINSASKELLSFVSGLNMNNAKNIIDYRASIGGFKSRSEILKVKGIGQKAFEQSAGFLRVRNSKNILDSSAVHPERYQLVEKIAKDNNVDVKTLIEDEKVRKSIDIKKYISEDVGLPTLKDIFIELSKPGRDPRQKFEMFEFDKGINDIKDLTCGITIPGIVTNVTAFGAFVDIGVHQDGLVHISQLSNNFVSDPSTVVKTGDKVTVKVLEVDIKRRRISLSMKN